MQLTREVNEEFIGLQEDVAAIFCEENFPMSGQLYWTLVESLAQAKLMEFEQSTS